MQRIRCPHCGSPLVEIETAEGLVTLRSPEGSELVARAQGIYALHCGQSGAIWQSPRREDSRIA